MNDFLQRYGRQSHDPGGAKTILAIDDADNKTIPGFYTLAPGAIAHAETPETMRRGLAHHDVPGFRSITRCRRPDACAPLLKPAVLF